MLVHTTTEGFNDVLLAVEHSRVMQGTRGITLGQVAIDRRTVEEQMIQAGRKTALNAAVVVSLDKHFYAQFLGRDMDYLKIPTSGNYVFEHSKTVILDIIHESFANEESPAGVPWPDIQGTEDTSESMPKNLTSTRRWRYYNGADPFGPILQASGELEDAVSRWNRSDAKISVVGSNPRMVIAIEDLPENVQQRAWVHNIGGPWGWHGSEIPARPFIPSGIEDLNSSGRRRVRSAVKAGFDEYCGTTLNVDRARANASRARRR